MCVASMAPRASHTHVIASPPGAAPLVCAVFWNVRSASSGPAHIWGSTVLPGGTPGPTEKHTHDSRFGFRLPETT
jgi:hypothetical protein